MSKSLVIVQQYLSWKGHYKQYFENLLDPKFDYLYGSNEERNYKNGTWIKTEFDPEKPLTFISKIKGRFGDSYSVFRHLFSKSYSISHLIEFEPLTYLLCSFTSKRSPRLLITMHSSDQLHYSSWLNNKISGLQRSLLEFALRKAVSNGASIVTHYQCHKDSMVRILGGQNSINVHVISYPTPKPESDDVKELINLSAPRFLIYGQIREDKGIYEFLANDSTKSLNITIAGKIVDARIFEFADRGNLNIIDKFLSDSEIQNLVDTHDYMLLPYPLVYTNGAGTFKDSLAKGMPVVCSDIDIFREIVGEYKVGVIFKKPEEIANKISSVTADDYRQLSRNCLNYAFKYDWNYMRNEYFSLYDRLLAN